MALCPPSWCDTLERETYTTCTDDNVLLKPLTLFETVVVEDNPQIAKGSRRKTAVHAPYGIWDRKKNTFRRELGKK